ncbi:MAG: hypothetical protein KDC71_21495 [Acidobacteria bacterium]|nr:hypothetical protein [Acidobacteriota bacterium]
MSYYMLLLRAEEIDFSTYSPTDFQRIMAEFDLWNKSMVQSNQILASASLQGGTGKTLKKPPVILEGPYSETELMTGIFIIQAENLDEATLIAKGCPFLTRGGSVELRVIPQLEFETAVIPIAQAQQSARQEGASL